MNAWLALSRIILIVALVFGSTPQRAMAGDQALAVHATMVAMSHDGMGSKMDKAAAGYCFQHCLAVLGLIPPLTLVLPKVGAALRVQPAVGVSHVSVTLAPTGPPPKFASV